MLGRLRILKNVIEKSFINWRVLSLVEITHVFQIHPVYIRMMKTQLKFEIYKIIIVNYMFLICCSQFRASSAST
jgi:hypothetical protein